MVRILLVPVLTVLYPCVSTFRSMCAVPNMAVYCSSLTLWFPGMLLTYFLNDFEMVPVTPIITGITFVFRFHMRCISIVRSFYFRIFLAYFFNHISIPWLHFCLLIIIIISCGGGGVGGSSSSSNSNGCKGRGETSEVEAVAMPLKCRYVIFLWKFCEGHWVVMENDIDMYVGHTKSNEQHFLIN